MRILTILLLFLVATTPTFAQYMLRGVVVDDNTGALLPSVNVFLQGNQSRGVLTNERGEYQINLSGAELQDQLVFSLLSYEMHREPLWGLDTANLYLNLRMKSSFVSLEEVVVISDLGLKQLVKRCLEKVPKNYGTDDYLLRAYARVYDIDSDTFSLQVEARLNIRDTKWPQPRPSQEDWLKVKPKVKIEAFRMPAFGGYSLRDRWPVLNGQYVLLTGYEGWVNKLRDSRTLRTVLRGKSILETMTFSNRGEYLSGQDTLIKIAYRLSDEELATMNLSPSEIEHWYSGMFLINKSDLAFLRITEGKLKEDNTEEFYRDVIYHKVDGRYYVKQAKEVMSFDYDHQTATYYTNRLLYVTEVITDPKAIRAAFRGKKLDYTLDLKDIRVRYDKEFWAKNKMLETLPAPEMMKAALKEMQQRRE